MILERALITVTPGTEQDFETALDQAKNVIARAQGFRSLSLQRGIEQPSTYLLLVEWESVADHMVGFRESDLFARWRELIGPYFASPPQVEHYEPVTVR